MKPEETVRAKDERFIVTPEGGTPVEFDGIPRGIEIDGVEQDPPGEQLERNILQAASLAGCLYPEHMCATCRLIDARDVRRISLMAIRAAYAAGLRAQEGELREALRKAIDLVWEHHEIGFIRRAYEKGAGSCELCKESRLFNIGKVLEKYDALIPAPPAAGEKP